LQKISTYQNKAVKIVGGGTFRDHATQLYHKLNILKLTELYKYEDAKIVYNSLYDNTSTSFSNYFIQISNITKRKRDHQRKKNYIFRIIVAIDCNVASSIKGSDIKY